MNNLFLISIIYKDNVTQKLQPPDSNNNLQALD